MNTHTVELDGVQQRYHVAGNGPICVAHSGGPGIGWEYLRMRPLEEHLTMVYVEPVGTGESGRLADDADYTLDTYVRYLHAVVEDLGAGPIALLGHSHGGFAAQKYALAHPVDALVLYDTSPVTGAEFFGEAVANIQQAGPEILAAFTAQHPSMTDDELTAVLRTIMPAYFADWRVEFEPLRAALRIWSAPSRGQDAPFDVRAELPRLTDPALIIVGEQDFICGPKWARQLHQAMPTSRLRVIENCGHLAHVERPEVFYPEVLKFLS
ncbi:alpha/beta fold hydrolase [Kutzneria sp. CA-103260]|uniref:alpha/beta fold hydrolase n=1 Tax=Kutzneria sp. CA-103260 TaxID=2802641 RepID=UPI001BAD6981|nr:alpha/beta hydrolase [Kutzneria sp. CA-103260]QUQ63013.1 hydrolase [Kutzneria sp. CA-103260]